MKTSMKKALSLVLVVCTLFACVIIPGQVITASAAEQTATISFADTAQRTSFSTTQQVWEQNGIKVTNNKGSSTNPVADYANPVRFYKNSEIIIEYPQMTKIEITCNTSSYATATNDSISGSTVSGSTVTITFDSPVNSFTFTASAQIRFDSITVTYNVDETLDNIKAELETVNAYMSLGYKYSAITTTSTTATDTLDREVTGITNGSYTDWSGETLDSGATYMGQSAGSYNSIQLRSKNSNSGIVTTASGGKVAKITVVWNSQTTTGRTLDIYGKNTAYTAATDLYGSNAGTKIGSIVCGTSTELVIEGDYEYIGLRSNSGAMYIDSIEIVWDTTSTSGGTEVTTTYSDSAFAIRCAVDAKLADIANDTAYGIKVSAGGREVYYTADDASSWTVDGDLIYIVLNLGDIINDKAKLSTRFTIVAFVEYNGNKVVSTNVKAHSVASMIDEYYTNPDLQIAEVEHLYNYLVENKLIDENA